MRSIEPATVRTRKRAGAPCPRRPSATCPAGLEVTRTAGNWELIEPSGVRASTRTDEPAGNVMPMAPSMFLNSACDPGLRLPWKLIVPLRARTTERPRRRVEIAVMVPLPVTALTWPLTRLVLMEPLVVCRAMAPPTLVAQIDPLVSSSARLPSRPAAVSVPAATATLAVASCGIATVKSTQVAVGRPVPIETLAVMTSPCCRYLVWMASVKPLRCSVTLTWPAGPARTCTLPAEWTNRSTTWLPTGKTVVPGAGWRGIVDLVEKMTAITIASRAPTRINRRGRRHCGGTDRRDVPPAMAVGFPGGERLIPPSQ